MLSQLLPTSRGLSSLNPEIPLIHPSAPNVENAFVGTVNDQAPKAEEGFVGKLMEYGRKFLENPKFLGVGLDILPGVALGLRVEGSVHTKTSSLVLNNPFRKAANTLLEKENPRRSVIWTQTGGIVELGLGFNGTLPIAYFAGVHAGFIPSSLLRYRCIKPHILGFFQSEESALAKSEAMFPFGASSARNLPAGAEYELRGQGRLRLIGALEVNGGTPVNSILNAGAGASGFVNHADAKEVCVNILALDGKDKVRVTLHQMQEDITQAGAMAYAGVISQIGPQFPTIGTGLLQGGSTLLSSPVGDTLNNYYTCLSGQASTSRRDLSTAVATFDLDLATPQGRKSYDALMKLSTTEADLESRRPGSGVRLLKRQEKEQESRNEVSANLFGDKLFLYQALTNEKNGRFETPEGKATLFRTAHFRQHQSGWFEPTQDVLWESVTLKSANEENAKTFFRLRYQKDGALSASEFDDYFGLANALSLKGREAQEHTHEVKNDPCRKVLCNDAQVTQVSDVYFTQTGIRNMQKATALEARDAYLEAVGSLRSEHDFSFLKGHASCLELTEVLQKYADECRAGWFLNFGHRKRLATYAASYEKLCGREISADSLTFENATAFGRRITQLKTATDHEELSSFFVNLGQSKGFRYKCLMGALAKLAGDSQTLVHRHELNGSAMAFKFQNGGKLESPSEIVTELLSRHL